MDPIHGELSRRASADAASMEWSPSPSGTVWRKRFHRVGPAESGQVTSLVRYQPGATFPAHDHPEGEEILVLSGVFSDEHGDWPAGTYLLNPEGFRHAPFSREGCELFVKLRQLPGRERVHVELRTDALAWRPGETPGVEVKPLYEQAGFSDRMRLERWAPGCEPGEVSYPGGVEIFVIVGGFEDEEGVYGPGCWLRLPPGASHRPRSRQGCELYVKCSGFEVLREG